MHKLLRGLQWWVATVVVGSALRAADPFVSLADNWEIT